MGRCADFLCHAIAAVHTFMDGIGGVHRYACFFADDACRLNVVGVVMGNEKRFYRIHIDVHLRQMLFYSTKRNACIYQYAVCIGAQIVTIAATATGQAYKFYLHNFSMSRLVCKEGRFFRKFRQI